MLPKRHTNLDPTEGFMDFEKLTERVRGFVQAAQTIAVRENHQRIAMRIA